MKTSSNEAFEKQTATTCMQNSGVVSDIAAIYSSYYLPLRQTAAGKR